MSGESARKIVYTPLDEIAPADRNPKAHNETLIADAIGRFGFVEPLVLDERTGKLVAGHGRRDQLINMERTGVSVPDGIEIRRGRWCAPVVRGWSSASRSEAEAAAVALNRVGEKGGWDETVLADILSTQDDLTGLGYDNDDLATLLASLGEDDNGSSDGEDDIPDAPAVLVTKPGDMWQLGRHKLLCGNADETDQLDRLTNGLKVECVLTDPPYGISLDTDWSSLTGNDKAILKGVPGGKYKPVQNDDRPYDASAIYLYFEKVREQFWFGADYYRRTIPEVDTAGSWLVWDKRNEASDGGIGSGFELLWSRQRHKRDLLRVYHFGAFGAEGRDRVHPTQKPVALLTIVLERWAPDACVVVDTYAGSGSLVIAAEQTGRTALLMEIDPYYCDVICKRFQKTTRTLPVLESTGEPYDFMVQ